jgi:hypothetical protein
VGDWERVVAAVIDLVRAQRCDALSLGLPPRAAVLLANGPDTLHDLHEVGVGRTQAGPADRRRELDDLTRRVEAFVARGPFMPGTDLVPPPEDPVTMPYRPLRTGPAAPDPSARGRTSWWRRDKAT